MDRFSPYLGKFFVTVVNMDGVIAKVVTNSFTKRSGKSFDVPHAVV